MKTNQDLAAIVHQLQIATEQTQETIGTLATERLELQKQIKELQEEQKRLQRRAIVAELTLKRLVTSINPKLSQGKLQQEIDRIIGETEDDRRSISDAIQEEILRSAVVDESTNDVVDETIDTLQWH